MMKHLIVLGLLASVGHSEVCPQIDATVHCQNGQMRLELGVIPVEWRVTGSANGQPCSTSETSQHSIVWNYASQVARLGMAICHYNIVDADNKVVGPLQIGSNVYHRKGNSWHNGGYPGFYTCEASQEACEFRKE